MSYLKQHAPIYMVVAAALCDEGKGGAHGLDKREANGGRHRSQLPMPAASTQPCNTMGGVQLIEFWGDIERSQVQAPREMYMPGVLLVADEDRSYGGRAQHVTHKHIFAAQQSPQP
jgi:hypothetical protein